MKLPKSTKLDFMILTFTSALLTVSNSDSEDENVLERVDNKDYKSNKNINRRLDNLQELTDNAIKEMYNLGGKDTYKWMKSNMYRIKDTLIKIQAETINLELLALQILYLNFGESERTKELAEPLYKVQLRMPYILDTIDLFNKTKAGHLNDEMYEQAQNVIDKIKSNKSPEVKSVSTGNMLIDMCIQYKGE